MFAFLKRSNNKSGHNKSGSRLWGRNRPRIGVTAARRGGWWMWQLKPFSLWFAGGKAVRIRPQKPRKIQELDGLLIGGGDDISVALYHKNLEPSVKVDEERDNLELTLAEQALQRNLPLLGVCRGAQMLNIAMGGTLHEDMYTIYKKAPKLRTILPKKRIHLRENSDLSHIMGAESFRVNALHSQSMNKIGPGLKRVAKDKYGIVQAIETTRKNMFCIGVQWHPEFLAFVPRQRALFRALVRATIKDKT